MDDLRRDLTAAFNREQSALGNLGGTPDRLLRDGLTARNVPAVSRGPLAAGIAAVLLTALVIGTFAYVRMGTGPHHLAPVPATSPGPSPTALPSPATTGLAPCAGVESSYGLIISAGKLEMIGSTGCMGPTAATAAPSVHSCADGLPAVLAPPVSASNDKVYFRDGDTKIRFMTPDGQTGDAATVPGGPTTVSFFSVSPDDQRIAVLVEDLSAATTIGLRLYVEDLAGGGHHADIYRSAIDKGQNGMTLWPSGWHQGRLILAVVLACSAAPVYHPSAWHVVDAANADRLAAIDVSTCLSSLLPSAGGVVCFDPTPLAMRIYDWAGNVTFQGGGTFLELDLPVGLSPSGQSVFFNGGSATDPGSPGHPSNWRNDFWAGTPRGGAWMATVQGHKACVWIDDSTILSPDAVTAYPSGTGTSWSVSGTCVGRFPGGL